MSAAAKKKATAQQHAANLRVLAKVAERGDFGHVFTHHGQWRRACDLVDAGMLTQKMVVYSITENIVNYRPAFWLTPAGRTALAQNGGGK